MYLIEISSKEKKLFVLSNDENIVINNRIKIKLIIVIKITYKASLLNHDRYWARVIIQF